MITKSDVEPFAASGRESSLRARTAGSLARYERAGRSLAGGVSSGLRRSARPYPLYFERGEGASAIDVDGNRYLDYTLAWGPNILGHCPPSVSAAIADQSRKALTFGAQHDLEFEVAELLCDAIPCADQVCYANSGTEIVQVALRLARAATGRALHLKFEGHYHGWDDSVLVSYHPTAEEIANSNGRPVPVGAGQQSCSGTVVAQWNDTASVEAAFAAHPQAIAAVICEPLLANSGCIPPAPGYLSWLRDICTRQGTLLIFDEVITGFRLALGGAQEHYGVIPDLATYAKAIGAGTALSAMAGTSEFMSLIAAGHVVHAGTLNGNPLALAAAKAALLELGPEKARIYADLHRRGNALRMGMERILSDAGFSALTTGEGPVFALHFAARAPRSYRDTLQSDRSLYSDFALALLDEGVMVLPDGRWYVSAAHTDAHVDETLAAIRRIAG